MMYPTPQTSSWGPRRREEEGGRERGGGGGGRRKRLLHHSLKPIPLALPVLLLLLLFLLPTCPSRRLRRNPALANVAI